MNMINKCPKARKGRSARREDQMSDNTQNRNARRNGKSRREVLRMAGAAGAAAAGFPLVGVARADSAKLKIGYIACMSGPRTDFGITAPWVLDRVKAVLKD